MERINSDIKSYSSEARLTCSTSGGCMLDPTRAGAAKHYENKSRQARQPEQRINERVRGPAKSHHSQTLMTAARARARCARHAG